MRRSLPVVHFSLSGQGGAGRGPVVPHDFAVFFVGETIGQALANGAAQHGGAYIRNPQVLDGLGALPDEEAAQCDVIISGFLSSRSWAASRTASCSQRPACALLQQRGKDRNPHPPCRRNPARGLCLAQCGVAVPAARGTEL